jgi:hypothetical protein
MFAMLVLRVHQANVKSKAPLASIIYQWSFDSNIRKRARREGMRMLESHHWAGAVGGKSFVRPSGVTQVLGGALPLRDIFGDHAGGFHRRLAELGVAGDLALDALAFGVQQVAQALKLADQMLDLR